MEIVLLWEKHFASDRTLGNVCFLTSKKLTEENSLCFSLRKAVLKHPEK